VRALAISALLLLIGCSEESGERIAEAPAGTQTQEASQLVCAAWVRSLERLVWLADGSFRYDHEGHALVQDALWSAMPSSRQADVVRMLSDIASCSSSSQHVPVVTIRSLRTNEVLFQSTTIAQL
jgi:hypothetical protein